MEGTSRSWHSSLPLRARLILGSLWDHPGTEQKAVLLRGPLDFERGLQSELPDRLFLLALVSRE